MNLTVSCPTGVGRSEHSTAKALVSMCGGAPLPTLCTMAGTKCLTGIKWLHQTQWTVWLRQGACVSHSFGSLGPQDQIVAKYSDLYTAEWGDISLSLPIRALISLQGFYVP